MIEEKQNILWVRRHHQDDLIHTRVGWTIATQSFLLIALAQAVDKSHQITQVVAKLLPWIGIISTSTMVISIFAGISTYHSIRSRQPASQHSGTGILGRSTSNITWLGFLPAIVIPVIFLLFWLVVIYQR